ncbi:cytochrome c biogenesis protein [Candidatus Microgenomates bacterium]|nr:MAG: cytochrome c biogenesis protein [Candidatus Microgenomates bacterium]
MQKYMLALSSLLFVFFASFAQASEKPIYFFYGTGCSHCATVEKYFDDNGLYEKYNIEKLEVYQNRDNAVFYNKALDDIGYPTDQRGVPTVVMGSTVVVGDVPIIENFQQRAENFLSSEDTLALKPQTSSTNLTLPAVIGASLVDAINPCAFAVLIVLMGTVLATGDKKKALWSGLAFSGSIFISYLLMGLGIYKALGTAGIASIFYRVVGWLAIALGILNLKDYFWYGKGVLMEVPLSWRPKLKKIIGSVTSPLGAFAVGFLVSLFLLPCTSGPYIVILGMLVEKAQQFEAISYLVLYNLIFVSPMVAITILVHKGLSAEKAEKIRQKNLKNLHLIAGIILLAMGALVLKG